MKAKVARHGDEFDKICVISDLHSVYLDREAFSCFLQAFAENEFDKLIINGDLLDLPMLMGEGKHKFEAGEPSFNLDEELSFTVKEILEPIRKVQPKMQMIWKPGNHEDRALRILSGNAPGLAQLVHAGLKRDRMRLESMLEFGRLKIEVSRGEKRERRFTDVDFVQKNGDRGAILHGHVTSKTRLKTYLDFYQCSGTSGHTHQMKQEEKGWYGGVIKWVESGCLCRKTAVTYLPIGKDPGWSHGFVTMWRNRYSGELFIKGHEIKDYALEFKGTVYRPV